MVTPTFRAKRIDTNEWIDGFYCRIGYAGEEKDYIIPSYASAWYGFEIDSHSLHGFEIDSHSLRRSFNNTDSFGNQIYDKDIVQFRTNGGTVFNFLIQWIDEGNEFRAVELDDTVELYGNTDTYLYNPKRESLAMDEFILMMYDVYGYFNGEYGGYIKVIGNTFDNPELFTLHKNSAFAQEEKDDKVEYRANNEKRGSSPWQI